MKTQKPKICPISNLPLPGNSHGNKKYHPIVAREAKGRNNKKRYDKVRNIDNLAIRLDQILAKHYPNSREKKPVNKELLDALDFAWDFNSAMTTLANGKLIFWILDYGYSNLESTNNSIVIFYGNNPVQQPNERTSND